MSKDQRVIRLISLLCPLLSSGLGLIALLGWTIGNRLLASFGQDLIPMAPSTASLFVLLAAIVFSHLWLPRNRRIFSAGIVLGSIGIVASLLIFALSSTETYSPIEHLGFAVEEIPTSVPLGHMSPITALCFAVVSLSLLLELLSSEERKGIALVAMSLASLVALVSFVLVVSYVYGLPVMYGGSLVPPALPTSVAFFFLALGLVAASSRHRRHSDQTGDESLSRVSYVLFLVFILLGAGIVAGGYSFVRGIGDSLRGDVAHQLSAIADLKSDQLTTWRNERLADGEYFFRNYDYSDLVERYIRNPNDSDARMRLEALHRRIRKVHSYDLIEVLDAQFHRKMMFPENGAGETNGIGEDAARALSSGQIVFQDFYFSEQKERYFAKILVPILDQKPAGDLIGILSLRIDPDQHLFPALRKWPTPSVSAETMIIRREGDDAVFIGELRHWPNAPYDRRISLKEKGIPAVSAALGVTGVVQGNDYRNVPVIAFIRPLPGSFWMLITKIDAAEALALMSEQLWLIMFITFALLLAAGATVGMVWRQQRSKFYKEQFTLTESLRESEARHRVLSSLTSDYVFRLRIGSNGDATIDMVSDNFASVTGRTLAEARTPDLWTNFIHPDDLGKLTALLQRLISEGGDGEIECRSVVHKGSQRWISVLARALRASPGERTTAILGAVKDITERKLAETATQLQSKIAANISEGVYLVSASDLKIVYANERVEEIFGYGPGEMTGKHVSIINAPSDVDPVQQAQEIEKALKDVGFWRGEVLNIRKDGTRFWGQASISMLRDSAYGPVYVSLQSDITERKQAEMALRHSERQFRSVWNNSADGMRLTDRDGRIIDANDAFCRLVKIPRDELLGQIFSVAYQREGPDDNLTLYQSRFDAGKMITNIVGPATLWNGDKIHLEVSSSFIDTIDEKRFLLCLFRDTSQRVRAEADAAAERERVQRQRNAIAVLAVDYAVTFGDVPIAMRKLTEVIAGALNVERASVWQLDETREEMQCIDLYESSAKRHSEGIVLRATDYPRYFASMVSESRINANDARTDPRTSEFTDNYLVPLGITSMLDAGIMLEGELEGVVCIEHTGARRDWKPDEEAFASTVASLAAQTMINSKRRQAEDALRENRSLLHSIINSTTDAIFVKDPQGRYLLFNSAAERFVGKNAEEVLGRNDYSIFPADEAAVVRESDRKVMEAEGTTTFEETATDTAGKHATFLSTKGPLYDSDGRLLGLFGIARDITERKQAEEALRHSQKLESIGTLAGGIAHDFNNLLNAVLGQSALALGKLPKESPAGSNVSKAIKAAERAADLTRQLLAYSGKGKFVNEEIDLNLLVKENIQILEVSVPKTAQLRFELGSPTPHIRGDVGQIQQVVMNLIINAGEALSENPGFITVRTRQVELTQNDADFWKYSKMPGAPGRYALLQVTDTGHGMKPDVLARIFDPFFTTKFSGRGLGLAAVLGIVRGHKGGIRITSEEGKGTQFEVALPIIDATSTVGNPEAATSPAVDGKGKTILIIDDEPSVLELMTDIFTGANFSVMGAKHPMEGVELYRHHWRSIGIVVLDYSMPGMDGKATFNELKKINKEARILLCSGYTEEEIESGFGDMRPAGFVHKPYKPSDLLGRVSKVLAS